MIKAGLSICGFLCRPMVKEEWTDGPSKSYFLQHFSYPSNRTTAAIETKNNACPPL